MKPSFRRYYERYSAMAPLVFAWNALKQRSKLRRLSMSNRQRDYGNLATDPERLALHLRMNDILLEAAEGWEHYDYGEGYFYQSLDAIGVTGFRDTAGRVKAMGLIERLAGKRVLDIGCNAGFLALSVAKVARSVDGTEINPYLIRIGQEAASYLEIDNVRLQANSFEDACFEEDFDVVCSFANHSTYDDLTVQSLEDYFVKCASLLRPGGQLLFESHAPEYEGEKLDHVIAIIERYFVVQERSEIRLGGFLDAGRTFIVATPRSPNE